MTQFVTARIPVAYIEQDGSCIENPVAANAAYLSWIAYPKQEDAKAGLRFVDAVRATHYKKLGRQAPADLHRVKVENIDRTIGRALRTIGGRRWPARWMALKLLGCDADYSSPMTVLQAAALLGDPEATKDPDSGALLDEADTRNITGRIWYPSLPALAMIMALPEPDQGKKIWWLQNPDWLECAVNDARELAPMLAWRFAAKTMFVPELIAVAR